MNNSNEQLLDPAFEAMLRGIIRGDCVHNGSREIAVDELKLKRLVAVLCRHGDAMPLVTLDLDGQRVDGAALAVLIGCDRHLEELRVRRCRGVLGAACAVAVGRNETIRVLEVAGWMGGRYWEAAFARNRAIKQLTLGKPAGHQGDPTHAHALAGIRDNASIEDLTLRFGVDHALAIGDLLKYNGTIQRFSMHNANINNEFLRELATVVASQRLALRTLRLSLNNIGDDGCVPLARIVRACVRLEQLLLAHNDIHHDGIVVLARAIGEHANLRVVDLSGNEIGDEGVRALGYDAVACSKTIERLDIANCHVTVDGALALADALRRNRSLRVLRIDHNSGVGERGVVALADALAVHPQIKQVHLNDVGGGVVGARALADMMRDNNNIEVLQLDFNRIGAQGAAAIADVIASTDSQLRELHLNQNGIGDDGAVALAKAIHKGRGKHRMRRLDLANNGITAIGARALTGLLADDEAKHLEHIQLGNNAIGDQGAQLIANALASNSTLRRLYLRKTGIGRRGAVALAQCIVGNPKCGLRKLSCGHRLDTLIDTVAAPKSAKQSHWHCPWLNHVRHVVHQQTPLHDDEQSSC